MDAAIQTKPHDTKVVETQTEPIRIQDGKEQHAAVTDAAAQTEDAYVCDKDVQTEALSSSNTATQTFRDKDTQTMGTRNCDKSTQINIQPKDVLMNNHIGITQLQEDSVQDQWTIEKLEE